MTSHLQLSEDVRHMVLHRGAEEHLLEKLVEVERTRNSRGGFVLLLLISYQILPGRPTTWEAVVTNSAGILSSIDACSSGSFDQ